MGRGKRSFNIMIKALKYKDASAKITKLPLMMKLIGRRLNSDTMELSYIPIYENIELPSGITAPISIIEHFINEASYHVILKACPCRSIAGCENHDAGFGCTFIGEGAREVSRDLAHHVSKEEALRHLREAAADGLITCIGKFEGDAIALGVKNANKLMTICHCCECCCVSTSLHHAAKPARDLMVKLRGLEIGVGDACTGCGKCVDICIFKQIRVLDGKAHIDNECKGCGRCAMACPSNAIEIKIVDPSYINNFIDRIKSMVEVS